MRDDPERSLLGSRESNPSYELARRYLALALAGDRRAASALILGAVDQGASLRDVYLEVFQPVQHEVGRLWELGRISVSQEHICTAITQLVMSQLYPRIFGGERRRGRLVATCLGGELHEIGVRMVADLLELDGWDTYYVGANAPGEAVIQQAVEVEARLLALSVTLAGNLDRAAGLIAEIRAEPRCARIKVLVGGQPFTANPALCGEVGADATAPDAEQAVTAAARLVGGP